MPAHGAQPVVKLPADVEHGPGVFRQGRLLPGVLRGPQHGDQRDGGGDVHLARHRVLEQVRITLQGRRQERLARDEQHHELRCRAERGPVRLGGQPVHVLAQVTGMRAQSRLADGVVGGLRGLQIRRERDLGVDDDVLAARQPHHHVRAQRTVVRASVPQVDRDDAPIVDSDGLDLRAFNVKQRGDLRFRKHARPPGAGRTAPAGSGRARTAPTRRCRR